MNKIVYKTDTGIAVITPSASAIRNKYSMEKIIAESNIPSGAEYKIVDESELPKDRQFRNAWGYDLKEDLAKSKEIWKDKLRADRKPLLEAQDVAFMKALETGDDTAVITTEKQRLRDITLLVDSCKTTAAIKKVAV